MKTIETLKKAAIRVEDYLAAAGIPLKHTTALEVVARVEGAKSWNALQGEARRVGLQGESANAALLAVMQEEADRAAQEAPAGDFSVRVATIHQRLKRLESRVGDSAPCVMVEWDPAFFGGDYGKVGNLVAVPLVLIDLADGSVEKAFEVFTGVPSRHIVYYTLDEVVNKDGDALSDEAGEQTIPPTADVMTKPLLWIGKDRPLNADELNGHTSNGERYIKVVVDVDWDLLGDIDALNDEVSERIIGSSCNLTDIGYRNHFPTDEERRQHGEPDSGTAWVQVTACWDPDDEV